MINIPLMQNNITQGDIDYLIDFLKTSDKFTQGKNVIEFEKQWSQWLGVKHSVFVNSGSSANFMTMAAIRDVYGAGEIIVPAITWSSDIASILTAGHMPVIIDVDLKNLAMSEEKIFESITPNTKAVFLTHVLGFNGLSQRIIDELEARNIILIEDVCESHGATFNGRKLGSFGMASNFSFYYAHHMSTIEGGMVCTNDDNFYQYMRMYRSHGMLRENTDDAFKMKTYEQYPDLNPEFIFMVPGYNMRSTELNAVIGLNQLKKLDANNKKRYDNFKLFLDNLDKDRYFTSFDIEGSINYAFVILLNEPNEKLFKAVTKKLLEEKVEFRRGTAGGGNQARQPFIKKACPNIKPEALKNADFVHFFGMYVGNYPTLENEKILALCHTLNNI